MSELPDVGRLSLSEEKQEYIECPAVARRLMMFPEVAAPPPSAICSTAFSSQMH